MPFLRLVQRHGVCGTVKEQLCIHGHVYQHLLNITAYNFVDAIRNQPYIEN